MDVLFKNETKYTKEELDRFQKFHREKNKKRYTFNVISFGILFFSFFLLNVLYKNWYGTIGIIILVGILYTYYFKTKPKNKKKNNKKQLEQKFIFEFTNKYVRIKGIKSNKQIPYYKFYRVYETDKNYYLYIDEEYSILINKTGFILGNVNEFRKFIKKKMRFRYKLEKN